ncbi:hypothetical protein BCR44DRAFT_1435015, partial [Catenaria anguillulae PL171]
MAINCCRRAPLPQRPHHPLATLPSLATHHRLSDPHQHLPRRRFRHHRPLLPFLLSRKVTIPATATAMAIASPRPLPHTTTSCAQSAATTKCRPTTLPRRSARQPMKTATMIPRMVATALQTSWVISWTRTRDMSAAAAPHSNNLRQKHKRRRLVASPTNPAAASVPVPLPGDSAFNNPNLPPAYFSVLSRQLDGFHISDHRPNGPPIHHQHVSYTDANAM